MVLSLLGRHMRQWLEERAGSLSCLLCLCVVKFLHVKFLSQCENLVCQSCVRVVRRPSGPAAVFCVNRNPASKFTPKEGLPPVGMNSLCQIISQLKFQICWKTFFLLLILLKNF